MTTKTTNTKSKKRFQCFTASVLVALVALASVGSMPSAEASITGRRLQLLGGGISFKKPLGDNNILPGASFKTPLGRVEPESYRFGPCISTGGPTGICDNFGEPKKKKAEKKVESPSLTFRNCYSKPRYASFGWYHNGKWRTEGGWTIGAGDTVTIARDFKHLPHNNNIYFRVTKGGFEEYNLEEYNLEEYSGFDTRKLCTNGRSDSTWIIEWESGAGKNEYKVNGKYRSCPVKQVFYKVSYSDRGNSHLEGRRSNNHLFKMGCS